MGQPGEVCRGCPGRLCQQHRARAARRRGRVHRLVRRAGHQPLPASPETVAAFIDAMGASKAPATVRRYVSSISTFHRAAGVANPCEALTVKLALKRMHREHGRVQQQAAPLNEGAVARMLVAAGATLRDLRDKALFTVAYTTMCRRAELVGLRRRGFARWRATGSPPSRSPQQDRSGRGRGDVCRSPPTS